jgi:hypothetical protein
MGAAKERGDKELEKEKIKQRREFSSQPPERQQPKRPEGFGEAKPTSSAQNGNSPPQRERPDVFVDAHAHVGRIEFHLDDLQAAVRLHAQVLDLLELSVGADASLGHIGLLIEDVQVDALVEVRLDAVENIVVRLIEAIDNNPEIIRDLTRGVGKAVESVGEGVGSGVDKTLEGVGSGADKALGGVGEGVSQIGEGVGEGVSQIGEGVGGGVEKLGEGAGKGVQGLGEGAGEGVKGVGEGVGNVVSGGNDNDSSDKENDKSDKSSEGRDGRRPGNRRGSGRKRSGGIAERNRQRKQRN